MKNTIRLTLLLSASALFATACTPVPFENQNTYNTGYTAPTPVPVTTTVAHTTPAPVPEAGPLSAAAPQTYTAHNTTPTAAANPTPVATVPQVPVAGSNVAAATSHTVPAAATGTGGNTTGSPYDTYAANSTGVASTAGTNYDYSGGSNNSYTSYGTSTNTTAAANTNSNNYYTGGNNSNSYDTYSSGGNNNYAATNTASAGGAAVQVFATVSQAKAERIRQDISSQGLQAIVDQVDGLYKVRVPYPSASQARANLIRVRNVSGTPGAFVTTR